jgi:hypothetical protein
VRGPRRACKACLRVWLLGGFEELCVRSPAAEWRREFRPCRRGWRQIGVYAHWKMGIQWYRRRIPTQPAHLSWNPPRFNLFGFSPDQSLCPTCGGPVASSVSPGFVHAIPQTNFRRQRRYPVLLSRSVDSMDVSLAAIRRQMTNQRRSHPPMSVEQVLFLVPPGEPRARIKSYMRVSHEQ